MPIDVDRALSAEPAVREVSWTTRDVLLYHLSLGAARREREPELRYTYEKDLAVLPTFAVVAGQGLSSGDTPAGGMALPGIDIDLTRILHGGQALAVHAPIPHRGSARLSARITHVWDKGKAAVLVLRTDATASDGTPLWTSATQIWARGEGGFGGEPGPAATGELPDREPDHVLTAGTTPRQALLYRLNGDLNPLHADPEFARLAGFEAPVLHGLASYGIVAKAIVDEILDGDVTALRGLQVRFAGTLTPGETIRTSLWRDGDRMTFTATCVERDDAPVLSHGVAEVTR